MRKPSIAELVYNTLYPRPRSCDPTTFGAHIARNLVPEVRTETSNFYGNLDCIESQYPGLDYSFPPHRKRLSRFHYHRRLFKAFDELGLTEDEIASLCRWEGTKSAKERYERDQGVTIRDTTTDIMSFETPRIPPSVEVHSWDDDLFSAQFKHFSTPLKFRFPEDHDLEEESREDGMESYGAMLSERFLEVTAALEWGSEATDEGFAQFEQWLKDVAERGDSRREIIDAVREGRPIYTAIPVSRQSNTPTSISSSPHTQRRPSTTQRLSPTLSGSALMPGMLSIPILPITPSSTPRSPRGRLTVRSHNPARTAR